MNRREWLLVRHAAAHERGPEWPDDRVRPLTPGGRRRFERVARGLASLGTTVDAILTSPLLRARQTAEVLAGALPGPPPIIEIDILSPGHDAPTMARALVRGHHPARLVLVGHEPGLGELASLLLGLGRPLVFRKGGACRIDLPPSGALSGGTLIWMLPPRVSRRIGR